MSTFGIENVKSYCFFHVAISDTRNEGDTCAVIYFVSVNVYLDIVFYCLNMSYKRDNVLVKRQTRPFNIYTPMLLKLNSTYIFAITHLIFVKWHKHVTTYCGGTACARTSRASSGVIHVQYGSCITRPTTPVNTHTLTVRLPNNMST